MVTITLKEKIWDEKGNQVDKIEVNTIWADTLTPSGVLEYSKNGKSAYLPIDNIVGMFVHKEAPKEEPKPIIQFQPIEQRESFWSRIASFFKYAPK